MLNSETVQKDLIESVVELAGCGKALENTLTKYLEILVEIVKLETKAKIANTVIGIEV